jgi:UPF0755 protein
MFSVKKKGRTLLIIVFPVLIILLSIGGFFWWRSSLSSVSDDRTTVRFVVQKGWGASQIGTELARRGLIKNSLAFKIFVQTAGKSSKIQAGEYSFSPSYSLPTLVAKLLKGPDLLWVTIPEGYRLEEIAIKFANDLDKEDKEAFIKEFLTAAKGEEGYLFPDSYLFPKDASVAKIVSVLENTFDAKTSPLKKQLPSDVTFEEIVILASLIERETRTNDERPMVAGVLYNRLNADWPLQVDASVQYAVATSKLRDQNAKSVKFWEPLTKADIEIASPYNTYKIKGLPPAPICSPGLSSIKAAVFPKSNDYWFYLHDAEGAVHFARTIEEHQVNIKKYLGK